MVDNMIVLIAIFFLIGGAMWRLIRLKKLAAKRRKECPECFESNFAVELGKHVVIKKIIEGVNYEILRQTRMEMD